MKLTLLVALTSHPLLINSVTISKLFVDVASCSAVQPIYDNHHIRESHIMHGMQLTLFLIFTSDPFIINSVATSERHLYAAQ
jgi:hypothetical protein